MRIDCITGVPTQINIFLISAGKHTLKHVSEALLTSNQNIHFHGETRKISIHHNLIITQLIITYFFGIRQLEDGSPKCIDYTEK